MATLFLVDIENLCGTGMPSVSEIRNARSLLLFLGDADETADTFVLGTHPGRITENVRKAWPAKDANGRGNREGFTYAGKDGGDKAISHWVSKNKDRLDSFDRVVIASGDRHFYYLVAEFRDKKLLQVCGVGFRHEDYWDLALKVRFFHEVLPGLREGNLNLGSFSQVQIERAIQRGSKGKRAKAAKPTSAKQNPSSKVQVEVTKILMQPQRRARDSKALLPLSVGDELVLKANGQSLVVRISAKRESQLSQGVISTDLNSSLAQMLSIMAIGDQIGIRVRGSERNWEVTTRP